MDAYHLYDRDWDVYKQLVDSFEYEISDAFNVATYKFDQWAKDDTDRTAFYTKDDLRGKDEYTFDELQSSANRLASYLEAEGIERGDRVGVNGLQKPDRDQPPRRVETRRSLRSAEYALWT